MASRATSVPDGTVMPNLKTAGPVVGAVGTKAAVLPTSFCSLTRDGTSPWTLVVMVPVYPPVRSIVVVPAAPVPVTSPGPASATGLAPMGLRTVWPRRSDQVREPKVQVRYSASVRVMVTWNVALLPGATVRVEGVTVTARPCGAVTEAT